METNSVLSVRLRDRRFYLSLAMLLATIVFIGFARTFYLNSYFARLPLPPLAILHGIAFSSWIVLLVVQSSLISAKQVRAHRRLGYASIALVVLMVAFALALTIRSAQRGFTPPGAPPPLSFMAVNFADVVMFPSFVGIALWYRNRPEIHKRLMIVATLAILTPAIARILFNFTLKAVLFKAYAISLTILLGCMLYDYFNHRRVHPAYLWGGLILLISIPLRLYIGGTAAWLSFAHWMTGT
jgi:hypothetical protein